MLPGNAGWGFAPRSAAWDGLSGLPPDLETREKRRAGTLFPALRSGPLVRYLRAISTSLPEGDGWLAISSFVSGLGARSLKPVLPCSPQIWVRKYRFPRR
jgi:hypothetical protein